MAMSQIQRFVEPVRSEMNGEDKCHVCNFEGSETLSAIFLHPTHIPVHSDSPVRPILEIGIGKSIFSLYSELSARKNDFSPMITMIRCNFSLFMFFKGLERITAGDVTGNSGKVDQLGHLSHAVTKYQKLESIRESLVPPNTPPPPPPETHPSKAHSGPKTRYRPRQKIIDQRSF
jgi:hypothetical protein